MKSNTATEQVHSTGKEGGVYRGNRGGEGEPHVECHLAAGGDGAREAVNRHSANTEGKLHDGLAACQALVVEQGHLVQEEEGQAHEDNR